eukprot:5638338-Pyramimonas_sp.AAC.1
MDCSAFRFPRSAPVLSSRLPPGARRRLKASRDASNSAAEAQHADTVDLSIAECRNDSEEARASANSAPADRMRK